MASVGDTFVSGDYRYTVLSVSSASSENRVSVKVVDKTKTAYGNIPSIVGYENQPWYVTDINSCFDGCSNMVEAPYIDNYDDPDWVSSANLFRNCSSLESVPYLPNSMGSNANNCFYGCSSLESINPISDVSIFNCGAITSMNNCFYGCSSLESIELENMYDVVYMENCFDGCSALESVVFGSSSGYDLVDMYCCFRNCASLTSAPNIPSGVTDTRGCFEGCSSLSSSPTISSSVTDMGRCFKGCTSLSSAPTIPSNVTYMDSCFEGCTSLSSAPTIPSGVTNMFGCFDGCTSLSSAPTIPNSVSNMEACFSGCTSLVSPPSIPSSVTRMGDCFSGCTSLSSAPTIPSGVTDMQLCFYGCTSLSGNITVSNNSFNSRFMLDGTQDDIYIIPSNLSASGVQKWRSVAASYGNVHYNTDDTVLSARLLLAQRCVSTTESTLSEDDPHCYFRIELTTGGYIPSGQTQAVSYSMRLNGDEVNPETNWRSYSHGLSAQSISVVEPQEGDTETGSKEAWYEAEVTSTSVYALTISDGIDKSLTLSFTLAKVGALLEAYHGDDGEGITIGTIAEGPGFNVAMDAYSFGERDYPMFTKASWNASSDESTLPTTPCFVLNTTDFSLWYCSGGVSQ